MKKLYAGAITTGAGTLVYTVPTGFKCDLTDLNISNTTSSSVTVKIHLVTSGDSVGTTNQFFPDVNVPANTVVQWTGSQTMNELDFIQGITSASGVNVWASGEEYRK